jgi:hypothetical protein
LACIFYRFRSAGKYYNLVKNWNEKNRLDRTTDPNLLMTFVQWPRTNRFSVKAENNSAGNTLFRGSLQMYSHRRVRVLDRQRPFLHIFCLCVVFSRGLVWVPGSIVDIVLPSITVLLSVCFITSNSGLWLHYIYTCTVWAALTQLVPSCRSSGHRQLTIFGGDWSSNKSVCSERHTCKPKVSR